MFFYSAFILNNNDLLLLAVVQVPHRRLSLHNNALHSFINNSTDTNFIYSTFLPFMQEARIPSPKDESLEEQGNDIRGS